MTIAAIKYISTHAAKDRIITMAAMNGIIIHAAIDVIIAS